MKATGGQILGERLAKHGVDTVFMIPGVQLDWAVDGLRQQPGLRMIVPRHEQTTTYMADGYYRASGRPGVAMVVPGPGVLNAAAGLATAYASNSKLFFIAGNIHSQALGAGYGLLHEIPHQSRVIAGLTKWHGRAHRTAEIAGLVDDALRELHVRRPRPTAVEISQDLLSASIDYESRPVVAAAQPDTRLESRDIDRAARLLEGAKLPVIYVGGGVLSANAGKALQTLAEKIGAPVVMSDNGRGALSDRHPLAMNTLAGRAVFERADVVLVVGSRFMDISAPVPSWPVSNISWIHVNIDDRDFTPPRRPELAIQADARVVLEAIASTVMARVALKADDAARVKQWAAKQIEGVSPQAEYIREMRAALPEDGIFVNELTQVGYLARVAYPVYEPRSYIGPGYQGTLGYGFPTALGAAVASGRRVLSITGDGGFGWNLQELSTARKYNLPVTVVIFSDGHFGNVRAAQKRQFGAEVAVDLCNPDFRTLARAFNVPASRVETPAELGAAVRASLSENGPVLIECVVGVMPSPWQLLRLQPGEAPGTPPPPNPLG